MGNWGWARAAMPSREPMEAGLAELARRHPCSMSFAENSRPPIWYFTAPNHLSLWQHDVKHEALAYGKWHDFGIQRCE